MEFRRVLFRSEQDDHQVAVLPTRCSSDVYFSHNAILTKSLRRPSSTTCTSKSRSSRHARRSRQRSSSAYARCKLERLLLHSSYLLMLAKLPVATRSSFLVAVLPVCPLAMRAMVWERARRWDESRGTVSATTQLNNKSKEKIGVAKSDPG